MILLTDEELQKDLAGFDRRLQASREKLAALPDGYLPYQEHKKREKTRRILESDRRHIQNLIHIAEEALVDA